jgi:hypothetical protein
VADAGQCVDATGLTPGEAAMAEPLAVTLHATARAGQMLGKRVLVTGCGPIGVLSILAARRAGAAEIVATDLSDFTLHGAAGGARTARSTPAPTPMRWRATADKGHFDVLYECTGVAAALAGGIAALRPARGDPATGARRRHDPADDGDHRQGTGPARVVPLPRRVPRGSAADAGGADRREAADHPSWQMSMPRSCSRSSTLRSESGNRMYIITARRMISGLVLKYLKGERFVIGAG